MEVVKKSHHVLSLTSERTVAQIFWITVFVALTIVGAKIEIPHYPVPYTLQTFFVLLSGAFLGSRNGSLSQIIYLSLGAIGLPVFAGAEAGFIKFAGPTAGYLLSWPFAAALVGYMVHAREGYWWTLFSFFAGLSVIFFFGSFVLQITFIHNWSQTFLNGFLIFSWWDVLKLTAAAAIYNEFSKRYRKLPQE
jgi:biotin transport system substrate-specific component